ncbi:DUF4214 domain-containing protein [Thioclava sp. GXIMD4216]|uniref:DUF4214 domain-containing protein n=1 Tax=Thioclava sp. GXIMD4216 TaxID=3131929 RepID=UPI0030CBC2C4
MGYLTHLGMVTSGTSRYMTQIDDLMLSLDGSLLYQASGEGGGIVVRDAETGAKLLDLAAYPSGSGLSGSVEIALCDLNGKAALLVSGPYSSGVTGYWVANNGTLNQAFTLDYGSLDALDQLEVVTQGGQNFLVGAGRAQGGFSVWSVGADNGLTLTARADIAAGNLTALETVTIDGASYILALSGQPPSLNCYGLSDTGKVTAKGDLDLNDGLAVSDPVALAQVTLGDQVFVLVGAQGSGSVSVAALGADGRLTITDQVNDDLTTRFGQLTVLEAINHNGRAYVVAGGGDDGISLMTLLPDGRLVHLETLADTTGMALEAPSALELAVVDGELRLYAAGRGEAESGVAALSLYRVEVDPGLTLLAEDAGSALTGGGADDVLMGGDGKDTLRGGAGDDILTDGAGADRLWGGAGADIFVFTKDGATDRIEDFEVGVDRIDLSQIGRFYTVDALTIKSITGGAQITIGGETLTVMSSDGRSLSAADFDISDLRDIWHVDVSSLTVGPQHLVGTAQNDWIEGDSGADTLTGGRGADTLLGGEGNDLLLGEIEEGKFDTASAQVVRLFQATLDRAPNAEGHLDWTAQILSGEKTLTEVAQGFVDSAEFQDTYGELNDTQFVTQLYQNVLGRAPDAAGLKSWTTYLAQDGTTRADVVVGFSESTEFSRAMQSEVLDMSRAGYQSDWVDDVFRLYQATLGRAPDLGGITAWTTALSQGTPFEDVVSGFVNSTEFQQSYGQLDNEAFVTLLYENVLGRAPGSAGLADWCARMEDQGWSRADVVEGFSQSGEFTRQMADPLKNWMVDQGEWNQLEGGAGDNILFGGMMADRFVFSADTPGTHLVVDYQPWDCLSFEGFGYQSIEDIRAQFSQEGDDAIFIDQDVEVVLRNTLISEIDYDSCQF